jgi:hypothetical protein
MSGERYVLVAYLIGLGLLVGHGVVVWINLRAAARRSKKQMS